MKLRCENLVKKYGPRTVVKGVSMEVNQGEIVGFLGPNGAGKTTSFYMITGLIVPNDGKIFLDDEEITKLPMFKRSQKGVGYLAQEASGAADSYRSPSCDSPGINAEQDQVNGAWRDSGYS